MPWWREAHRLFPENFTYKRQAWTLVTTPAGAEAPDLIQGPNDVYEGNWLDDVLRRGRRRALLPAQRVRRSSGPAGRAAPGGPEHPGAAAGR